MRGKQGTCMLTVALLLILSFDAAGQTSGDPYPDIKESSPRDALQ